MPNTAQLLNVREASRDEPCKTSPPEGGWQIPVPMQAIPANTSISDSTTADQVHLVERLFFLLGKEAPRVVVFCGAESKDGSDLICAKAAEVLAGVVKDAICLIDADLRAPTLHLRYRTDDAYIMGDHRSSAESEDSKHGPWPNLWVVPASLLKRSRPGLPLDRVRDWLKRLRERFGYVLICAPPLGVALEGLLWGRMADGVVVTLHANSTKRETAMKVRTSLKRYNVPLLGVVLMTGTKEQSQ
jgi:Mrp family chromosome partitioning ATPase